LVINYFKKFFKNNSTYINYIASDLICNSKKLSTPRKNKFFIKNSFTGQPRSRHRRLYAATCKNFITLCTVRQFLEKIILTNLILIQQLKKIISTWYFYFWIKKQIIALFNLFFYRN